MMKKFNSFSTKRSAAAKAVLSAGILSFALAGCGSDGKDGEDGKDGVVGVNIDAAKSVNAVFTNATVEGGVVTVDFKLQNDNGVAVLGLTKDHDLRFGIAQLSHVTEMMGETEVDRGYQWQAYINAEKAPNPDWVPEGESHINPSNQFQAGVEKAGDCETCFVDNEDGSYTYTYQQNIGSVVEPIEVTYNADETQRATMELELSSFAANANYDWQPSSGATEGIQTRDVVSIETCYTCHQPDSLELHGGRRINIENCASCHTGTSGDPESGNSVDFTFMIHAIHKGQDRMTSTADGMVPAPYKVIGYGGGVHDYGKVMFPQKPAADCASCHVTGENAPANADLFKANLSNTACVGCHTEKPSQMHSSTDCMSCHIEEGYARSGVEAHGDATKAYDVSKNYSATFTNIKPEGQGLSFDVQLLDDAGAPIAKEFVYKEGYSNPYIVVSWDVDADYPAYKTGSKYSERRISLYDSSQATYDEASKKFSVVSANLVLPADINGKSFELLPVVKTCFKKGGYGRPLVEPMSCYDEDGVTIASNAKAAYIQDEPMRFIWNNGQSEEPAVARRSIVDDAKCHSCHGAEFYHDSNGVNCQACHTSDKSIKESERNSGKFDKPTSFAYKAHHAEGHYLKYAGVGSKTVVKTDCKTCHTDNGFELGRSPERVWNYPNMETLDSTGVFVSSDAGTCLSCHQKYLSDAGKSHIVTNGGILDGTSAEDVRTRAAETCQTCHSPEKVMALHGH